MFTQLENHANHMGNFTYIFLLDVLQKLIWLPGGRVQKACQHPQK